MNQTPAASQFPLCGSAMTSPRPSARRPLQVLEADDLGAGDDPLAAQRRQPERLLPVAGVGPQARPGGVEPGRARPAARGDHPQVGAQLPDALAVAAGRPPPGAGRTPRGRPARAACAPPASRRRTRVGERGGGPGAQDPPCAVRSWRGPGRPSGRRCAARRPSRRSGRPRRPPGRRCAATRRGSGRRPRPPRRRWRRRAARTGSSACSRCGSSSASGRRSRRSRPGCPSRCSCSATSVR